ncbi:MAG: P1 family peptidase [Trueperaceae bacterium]
MAADPLNVTITAIPGIEVGHHTDLEARTGCTVVMLPEGGCVASGTVLGSAPGSRESALLSPEKTNQCVHAVLLTGGSAFGLAAADGVVRWLEERGRGIDVGVARVPIVPTAVLFDLAVGSATVRPTADNGYAAASAATAAPVVQGRVGAGTGATVGKLRGPELAVASGVGSHFETVAGALVGALAVSNAVGNLVDPDTGQLLAGVPGTLGLAAADGFAAMPGANTTLVVVATDARISKAEAQALSQSAHIGIARVTRPSHTVFDGDSAFVVSTGTGPAAPLAALSVGVQEVVARALINGWRAGRASA